MNAHEVNIDGLIGPTHHYGGHGVGNLASLSNAGEVSKPRQAALQGLYKMKMLADLGLKQMVLPPQERPDLHTLRSLGFTGSDADVIAKAHKEAPQILAACCSAAGAWAANAATISPSIDSHDSHVHITPANLAHSFHRSLEPLTHGMALICLFPHPEAFAHHEPLPPHAQFGDEGSANWIRFCRNHAEPGVELFVWGKDGKRFPARQTEQASRAIARLHNLKQAVFAQQNPDLIDAGVFHNDIAALGNQNVLLYHEKAWVHSPAVIEELRKKVDQTCHTDLIAIEISSQELPVDDLISSYLLNSQLVTLPSKRMALIAPVQTRDNPHAKRVVDQLLEDTTNPISRILYFDLHESMKNGGGPACLRLRATLTDSELEASHKGALLDGGLYAELVEWVNRHYRDELRPDDLADPDLLFETHEALDALTMILDIGPLYRFQAL